MVAVNLGGNGQLVGRARRRVLGSCERDRIGIGLVTRGGLICSTDQKSSKPCKFRKRGTVFAHSRILVVIKLVGRRIEGGRSAVKFLGIRKGENLREGSSLSRFHQSQSESR